MLQLFIPILVLTKVSALLNTKMTGISRLCSRFLILGSVLKTKQNQKNGQQQSVSQ